MIGSHRPATNFRALNESDFARLSDARPEVGEETVAFIDRDPERDPARKSARSSLSLRPLEKLCAAPQAWVRRLSGRATARD
jgi:hypothetical protein